MLFAQGVKGQEYKSIVDTTKTWSTLMIGIDFYHTYWTFLSEDTVINGNTYKKVLTSDSMFYFQRHIGFIREDSSMKVYFMNLDFEEGLIYDFDVNKGDTIEINNTNIYWNTNHTETTLIVDSVYYSNIIDYYQTPNNIFFLDSIARKIIVVRNVNIGFDKEIWIEEIGSIAGILESGNYTNNYYEGNMLICNFQGNNHIYFNPYYSYDCYYTQLNINKYRDSSIFIYPNPIDQNDYLTITAENEIISIQVFDLKGFRLENQVNYKYQNKVVLNFSNFSAGVYILQVKTSNNVHYGKVIKTD